MINTKKKIKKTRTEKFLNEFPIIFLLQHNNFTVKDWLYFKQKIIELSEKNNLDSQGNIDFLNIKNSVFKKSLINHIVTHVNKEDSQKKTIKSEILESLCQGPNVILGCKTQTEFVKTWNLINSFPKLLFISCFFKNQILNHLDLQTFLKTDDSIYNLFFHQLDKKTEFYHCLHSPLQLYPLISVQHNFLNTIQYLKELKKKEYH